MKQKFSKTITNYWLAVAIILLLAAGSASAEPVDAARILHEQGSKSVSTGSSWALAIDNDVLVPGSRDQDYTYGINLTFAGGNAAQHPASLHRPLGWIDRKLGLADIFERGKTADKIEYGLFGFTPEDKTQTAAQPGDRPYAGLVYVSSTRESYDSLREESWQSSLTLGILGLSLVGDLQDAIHAAIGVDEPMGWDNQISNGGEPTLRYSISKQKLLYSSGSGFEVKSTVQGSIGYITEASWSLSARTGVINTPWLSFNPEQASYGEKSNPIGRVKSTEHYAWAGIALKLRAYNAFLEGQFKDSAVTYRGDEINRGILEAWAGYTMAFDDGYSFTYSIRGHSSELRRGVGDRNVIWGGVLVSKSFS